MGAKHQQEMEMLQQKIQKQTAVKPNGAAAGSKVSSAPAEPLRLAKKLNRFQQPEQCGKCGDTLKKHTCKYVLGKNPKHGEYIGCDKCDKTIHDDEDGTVGEHVYHCHKCKYDSCPPCFEGYEFSIKERVTYDGECHEVTKRNRGTFGGPNTYTVRNRRSGKDFESRENELQRQSRNKNDAIYVM